MTQFSVYKNKNSRTKLDFPLLVDVQSDLLDELHTRVVIPLTKAPALARKPLSGLTPHIDVEGSRYLLVTPQLAGVAQSELGAPIENISGQRNAIVSALDMLITGI